MRIELWVGIFLALIQIDENYLLAGIRGWNIITKIK